MSEQPIDLPEFLERVQDDKDLILELLDIFDQDYAVKRKLFDDVVSKKDFEQLKSITHSLKGASGNISAKQLRSCFLKLEEMAKMNDVTHAPEVLKELDEHYQQYTAFKATLKEKFKK